jgi:hypothetical protein
VCTEIGDTCNVCYCWGRNQQVPCDSQGFDCCEGYEKRCYEAKAIQDKELVEDNWESETQNIREAIEGHCRV